MSDTFWTDFKILAMGSKFENFTETSFHSALSNNNSCFVKKKAFTFAISLICKIDFFFELLKSSRNKKFLYSQFYQGVIILTFIKI